jgi:predicted Zn-dependent protease
LGFLNPPVDTLRRYKASDSSMEANYARTVAYMKLNETQKALAILDPLIEKTPKDPFLHEMRGDILRDAGRTQEASTAYRKAIEILPWAALIRLSLAQMQIAVNDPKELDATVANIKEAIRYESEIPRAWRQLATAYGRQQKHGLVSHALAEEALLKGDIRTAAERAKRAMRLLPNGSAQWIRAQDIELQAKRLKKDKK